MSRDRHEQPSEQLVFFARAPSGYKEKVWFKLVSLIPLYSANNLSKLHGFHDHGPEDMMENDRAITLTDGQALL